MGGRRHHCHGGGRRHTHPVVPFEEAKVVARARRDADIDALTIAHDRRCHGAAGRSFGNQSRELPDASDAFSIELNDDVPFFQAGFGRGTVLIDLVDHDAGVPFPLGVVGADIGDRHAEPAAAEAKDFSRPRSDDPRRAGLPVSRGSQSRAQTGCSRQAHCQGS